MKQQDLAALIALAGAFSPMIANGVQGYQNGTGNPAASGTAPVTPDNMGTAQPTATGMLTGGGATSVLPAQGPVPASAAPGQAVDARDFWQKLSDGASAAVNPQTYRNNVQNWTGGGTNIDQRRAALLTRLGY